MPSAAIISILSAGIALGVMALIVVLLVIVTHKIGPCITGGLGQTIAKEAEMRNSRFSESQIIGILKEVENGRHVKDVCREHGISDGNPPILAAARSGVKRRALISVWV